MLISCRICMPSFHLCFRTVQNYSQGQCSRLSPQRSHRHCSWSKVDVQSYWLGLHFESYLECKPHIKIGDEYDWNRRGSLAQGPQTSDILGIIELKVNAKLSNRGSTSQCSGMQAETVLRVTKKGTHLFTWLFTYILGLSHSPLFV